MTGETPCAVVLRRVVFFPGIFWCLATAFAFSEGSAAAGWVLGGMTASTALLAFTHICIPSQVLVWVTGRVKRARD
jgi:hypothetical protein